MRGADGQDVKRRKLLTALQDARGLWKAKDHPELKDGTDAFVEKLREENETRLRTVQR